MTPFLSLVILKSGSIAAIAYGKHDQSISSTMNGTMGAIRPKYCGVKVKQAPKSAWNH
jgi:hypothetical protein